MPFLNLTQQLGTATTIFYNQSYIYASQPPHMTTQTVWLFCISVGIILLLFSRVTAENTAKDLSGIISMLFLLVSAIQAFAVDVMTGTTYTENTVSPVIGAFIETHTIYHYDLVGVVLIVLWVISLANLYLLWLDHKRITEQQPVQIDKSQLRGGGGNQNNKRNGGDDDEE